jgi:hypothetical protein
MLHCDFCGLDFEPECAEKTCTGCPLARGCQHIACPRCGYTILPEAKLVSWLRSLKKAWQQRNEEMHP